MRLYFLVLAVLCCTFSKAQDPQIIWQNTIGGDSGDALHSVDATDDGGFILGGNSGSGISGDKTEDNIGAPDYWVVKLNADGTIAWQNTIGGDITQQLFSIKQTSDGGYILGGFSQSGVSGDKTEPSQGADDYWIIKLDATGSIEWQNTIGGQFFDYVRDIVETSDGGYLVGGVSDSPASGDKSENVLGLIDYWVVKLDNSGVIEWENTIGGDQIDDLQGVVEATDGGYIISGSTNTDLSDDKTEGRIGGRDLWVLKLDLNGNIVWQNTIGGTGGDFGGKIVTAADGNYFICAYSNSDISADKTENSRGSDDYWVIKIDVNGQVLWDKTVGGNDQEVLFGATAISDGGVALNGISFSNASAEKSEDAMGLFDYWVVRLDSSGNLLWENTIGGDDQDRGEAITQAADGSVVVGGWSRSDISGDKDENSMGADYWVLRLENTLGVSEAESSAFSIFPVPAENILEIRGLKVALKAGRIYDQAGRLVSEIPLEGHAASIHIAALRAGLYLLQIDFANGQSISKSFVKE